MPTLTLEIGGRRFAGWTKVIVTRSVEQAATQFGVVATRTWPGQEDGWWIEMGDRVQVRVNEHLVCTGWIDVLRPAYRGDNDSIAISGRGLVCDLVDCSHIGPPWQWKNVAPAAIIDDIAGKFAVPVVVDTDLGAPIDFAIQQGEAGWEAIDRLCSLRQVMAYDQPDGALLVTRGSELLCPTPLVQGVNIYDASAELDDRDRFSHYIVKGQQPGGDDVSPEQAAQSLGEAFDRNMRRYRPKLLVQSADTDNGTALDRASWEAQQAWGNARTATIIVTGWLQPNGELWPINRQVDVVDRWLQLDRRLSITAVQLDLDENGLRTELTLQPFEALTPKPPDPGKQPKGKGKGKGKGDGSGASFWDQVAADRIQGEARRKETKQ